jgi:hypothetical protein
VKSLRSGSGTHVRTTPLTVAVWTPPVATRSSRCHRPGPPLTILPGRHTSAASRPPRQYGSPPRYVG